MNSEKTGKLIAKLRREMKLNQRELAEKLGVSDKAVSKWECGRGCPDISLINKLAEIFGLGTESLLEGEINNESTDGGNMKNIRFYRCRSCGNVISATGAAEMICCSRKLEALKLRSADEEHKLKAEKTDGDIYITFEHPMEKEHYLCFAAYVRFDSMHFVRLYPEQGQELRIPEMHGGKIYFCCSKDGLFVQNI